MMVGRVTGTVVSTNKIRKLTGAEIPAGYRPVVVLYRIVRAKRRGRIQSILKCVYGVPERAVRKRVFSHTGKIRGGHRS